MLSSPHSLRPARLPDDRHSPVCGFASSCLPQAPNGNSPVVYPEPRGATRRFLNSFVIRTSAIRTPTPLESALPRPTRICTFQKTYRSQIPSATPLVPALTSFLVTAENKGLTTPAESILTKIPPLTPFTVRTSKIRGWPPAGASSAPLFAIFRGYYQPAVTNPIRLSRYAQTKLKPTPLSSPPGRPGTRLPSAPPPRTPSSCPTR
jgi:hypothetical protein